MDAKVTLCGVSTVPRIDAPRYIQSTSAEHKGYTQFLRRTHGQFQDLSEGHEKQCKVGGDLDRRVRDPPRLIRKALCSFDRVVPKPGDWRALKDGSNTKGHACNHDPSIWIDLATVSTTPIKTLTHDMAGNAERLGGDGKDAVVQADNRRLVE